MIAITLFVYNRPDLTLQTLNSLLSCKSAEDFDLFIYSDAPKNEETRENVDQVRSVIDNFSGFRKIKVIKRNFNLGLARSIITGVSQVFNEFGYDKVIVIEDDLKFSGNFLTFMSEALSYYESESKILNISGFSYDNNLDEIINEDVFLWGRATSWGWATWKDRWDKVDWNKNLANEIKNLPRMIKFSKYGADLPVMLRKQSNGKINSWAIRWCYHQFQNSLLSVVPLKSKVDNDGFGAGATHCINTSSFNIELDERDSHHFKFEKVVKLRGDVFKKYIKNYSLSKTVKKKFKGFFND